MQEKEKYKWQHRSTNIKCTQRTNKETDGIIYLRRCWWNASEQVNEPNNNDKARNSSNAGEMNHTANNQKCNR